MKCATSWAEYQAAIAEIKTQDRKTWFSRDQAVLTPKEKKLNDYMQAKRQELIGERKYIYDAYSPSLMFHLAKQDIEHNHLFDIFKKMPQGGNLHIHTGAAWNTEAFTDMLAIDPNVYVFWDPDAGIRPDWPNGKLFYLTQKPAHKKFYNYHDIAEFDSTPFVESKRMLTFIDRRVDDIEYIWDGFNDYFIAVSSILKVRAVYKKYYVAAFKHQYHAGNDYIEIRAGVPELVDNNDGEIARVAPPKIPYNATPPEALTLLKEAWLIARNEGCPDLTVKAIVAPSRRTGISHDADIKEAVEILKNIPAWQAALRNEDGSEFVIGFDLVSEEDTNHKTDDYAKAIIEANSGVDFYFHDGESNWADNDNVHSAWALGTKRIGHGINLYNFPTLMKKIRDEKICLEICPISNQMLRYTKDLRIHPIAQFMQQDVQCTICSDDPQIFETAGLTWDLWEVYHGAMIDLRDIKQLIENSYRFSAMNETEKAKKLAAWAVKWNQFIDEIQPQLI
ncbi:hypothetical protein [Phytobacter sp. AG2a]